MPLDGATALVTGASRGIGLAIARALIDRGVRVALVARNELALRTTAKELGDDALAIPGNVANPREVEQIAATVSEAFCGVPDILVNNAGIFQLGSLETLTPEQFSASVQTNLMAPFFLMRAFLPAMRARERGHIVTIGSIADRAILPGNGAYAPAKFGARALHEVLRAELRGSGVRATLVAPAATDTSLWDTVLASGNTTSLPTRDVMLQPSVVADAVMYAITQPPNVNIDELRLSHS